MEEVKNEFLKSHPNDNIDLVFGASGKYYQLLKQGREFDLFFQPIQNTRKQFMRIKTL